MQTHFFYVFRLGELVFGLILLINSNHNPLPGIFIPKSLENLGKTYHIRKKIVFADIIRLCSNSEKDFQTFHSLRLYDFRCTILTLQLKYVKCTLYLSSYREQRCNAYLNHVLPIHGTFYVPLNAHQDREPWYMTAGTHPQPPSG